MTLTRKVSLTALIAGAALALAGCSAAPAAETPNASGAEACTEVRNVTNGALNTLVGSLHVDQDVNAEYFAGLAERVDALVGTVDSEKADAAFKGFSSALTDASAYAADVPAVAEGADEAEVAEDPALADLTTKVQDAAADAAANCSGN